MENKTQIQMNKYNINNKSYSNFNSFYKRRKKRYLSSDINDQKNYNNYYYITDSNNNSESNIFLKKMNRSSTNNNYYNEKMDKSLPIHVCQTCFDKEMLEEQRPYIPIDNRKEKLREQFIKQNPFIFIDKMNEFEKRRIQQKVDNHELHLVGFDMENFENFEREFEIYENALFEGIINGIVMCGGKVEGIECD